MLPILKSEVAERYKWVSEEELLNYYSIGQCTPGMIAVNAASFIGYKLRRLSGLIVATMGVIAPSIVIILLLALLLRQYMDNQYVQWAFGGIRLSVVAMIINTVADMWRKGVKNIHDYMIFTIALVLLFWCNLSAIIIVLLSATTAFIPYFRSKKQ